MFNELYPVSLLKDIYGFASTGNEPFVKKEKISII